MEKKNLALKIVFMLCISIFILGNIYQWGQQHGTLYSTMLMAKYEFFCHEVGDKLENKTISYNVSGYGYCHVGELNATYTYRIGNMIFHEEEKNNFKSNILTYFLMGKVPEEYIDIKRNKARY